MKNLKQHKLLSLVLILAYVLSACSGVPAGGQSSDDQDQEVVFTGTVETVGAGQWTVSGQVVTVNGTTAVDASIAVGDNVKVEAMIDQNGVVTAVKIELVGADDVNDNDDNSNDDNANSNDDNGNANDDNTNGNENESVDGAELEITGVVEVIATDSITINGVLYQIAEFTEFKDLIAVGDQVKAHVIVNTDGTFTIREIEKLDDDANSNDDNGNDDDQGNDDNGNDDNGNDDQGNDDNGNDDNGNDDNGNDDDDNDDNSNDDDSNDNDD